MSVESVLASKNLVKGFLKPVFYDELGRGSALVHDDFCKVRDGYACARCLAEYVTYLAVCPVCGLVRDLAQDLEAADPLHVQHLRERLGTEGMDLGGPAGFDEFMHGVEANNDIDQVPLSKLKKRRRR